MKRAVALAQAAAVGVACSATEGSADVRFGGAVGYVASRATIDREGPIDVDPKVEDASGAGGFVEAVAGESLHLRLLYHREREPVDSATDAAIEQVLTFGLLGGGAQWNDWLAGRMFAGLGLGYTDVAFAPGLDFDVHNGTTLAFAIGGELLVHEHVVLGAMTWTSLFGEPGDTYGVVDAAMAYVGVRF